MLSQLSLIYNIVATLPMLAILLSILSNIDMACKAPHLCLFSYVTAVYSQGFYSESFPNTFGKSCVLQHAFSHESIKTVALEISSATLLLLFDQGVYL